ncbi:MAG: serine/threonine protein kinase, partial [Rhodothermaceae bacterium]|nr:serine/threonine protein kinase [Rhodothermaceae bacterium]
PYRVLRLLGRGGMGAVYLAERADGQFEQTVALKLIREGFDSPALRARFLHERQTLARLQHPGIARLLDGGLDDAGRPFFAMEVVEGERLDRYCDTHRLGLKHRLLLFSEVCEAVHYAHQNLVVHRDLKPSNILVTTNGDAAPHVKLLDFGVAKLLERDSGEAHTQTGLRAMTPEYAAPEQVRGAPVTTAADVYSLGVVLYELLTGHRPYDVRALSPGELERVVCETEPPRPSTVVTRAEAAGAGQQAAPITPETVSAARATEPDTLARRLAGDLDTIVLKALAKEPKRRYASAEAFLEDIRRYLNGLPVRARPDTLGYRTRKFVQRHRTGVAAAALVLVSLLAGLGGVAWQAREAARERDRARTEADKAERALDFLVDLFEQADPGATAGATVTAREVLDRAAERLAALDDQPEAKATLLDAIGRVYHNLGLFDQAEVPLSEALALRRTLFTEPHPDLAASLHRLAFFHYGRSAYTPADSLYREAIVTYRAVPQPAHLALADALHDYSVMLRGQGRTDEAEPLIREALNLRRTHLAPAHPDIGASLYVLAALHHDRGDFDTAEPLFREAVALYPTDRETLHPEAADARAALGQFLLFRGELDEIEPLFREALAIRRRLYGDEHPDVARSLQDVGMLLYERGQSGAAEPYLREAIEMGTRTLGANHFEVLGARQALAHVWFEQEHFTEALASLREVAAAYTQLFGEDHGTVLSTRLSVGRAALRAGDPEAAADAFEAVIAVTRRTFGDTHPYVGRGFGGLGATARVRGDLDRATTYYRQALTLFEQTLRPDHEFIAEAQRDLGGVLLDQGEAAQAESLLRAAYDRFSADSASAIRRANTQSALGEALVALGRPDEAAPLLTEAHATLRDVLGPEHRFTRQAQQRLAAFRRVVR